MREIGPNAGAVGLTRILSTIIYGVSTTDATTYLALSVVFALTMLLACYLPARRVTRLDAVNVLKKAQIEKRGACHMFRHTCATLMLEGGADIRYIQQMLGHALIETTQIYTLVSIRRLKEVHTATHPARLKKAANEDDPDQPAQAGVKEENPQID